MFHDVTIELRMQYIIDVISCLYVRIQKGLETLRRKTTTSEQQKRLVR